MTTVVLVQQGGTGANSAAGALAALGAMANTGGVFSGQVNISSGGLVVTGNTNIDSGTLFVDSVSNQVGVGNNNPQSKLTVAGTIESTTGGVKFPDGTTQTTAAASVTGIPTLNIVTGTAVTTISAQHYVLTNAAQTTVTLAASPSAGDLIYISARNNLANNLLVPNGNKIESNTSNVILDLPPYSVQLRYINANLGWILI